jgi:hypothetical protein
MDRVALNIRKQDTVGRRLAHPLSWQAGKYLKSLPGTEERPGYPGTAAGGLPVCFDSQG